MTGLLSMAIAGCLSLGTGADRITAGDLAARVPAFAALAPDTSLVPAPLAGARRTFHAAELRRILSRAGVDAAPESEVCVERAMGPLDADRLREAMSRRYPGASISILDFSHAPAPAGEIEFPPSGLRETNDGALWSGYVVYGLAHRFPIWAKVRIASSEPRVVALGRLSPGRPISAGQIRVQSEAGIPASGEFVSSVEEAAGKVPRRFIASGAPIRREWLENPNEIERGDRVLVEVRAGAAHLELTAVAQAAGSSGDLIPVLNPSSKRRFTARVEGKGRVSVEGGTP
jgi:flagella basal body P-ring formation protein FlgA